MDSSDFVHLHNHTMYSLLDGAIKIPQLLATAAEMGMKSLAITDHGNLFGAIEFYKQALKHGINPIIGIETYIVPGDCRYKKPVPGVPEGGYHLILLAKNEQGYKNLLKLSSLAYLEGFYFKPRIDKKELARHAEGLICLSACLKGEVAAAALKGDEKKLSETIESYLEIFDKNDFYLEIQDHGLAEEAAVRSAVKRVARQFALGLVATNDCHYLRQEHHLAHDALLCLQTGKVIADKERMRYPTDQLYFKSADQMKELFSDVPEAIENSLKIAERCDLKIALHQNLVPKFPLPDGYDSPDQYLEIVAREGLARRYKTITPEVEKRLEYELGVIRQMGYSGYFLIVKDFIDYAREIGVSVGPGRGSAAGSLVSYCLRITDIDPIHYNLLFERFLNPERVSMPDIDIDFSDRKRDQVIEYVTRKYGRENVAQIITFGTMAARAVVRDVGRVLGVPYGQMDRVAKMIPNEDAVKLERALELSADLRNEKANNPDIARVIEYSMVLEGLARHASTHAAGVVIAPAPLTEFVPLYQSNKDEITTQYDMRCIEEIGLIKMDFLGLKTLTVIEDTVAEIKRNRGIDFDPDSMPIDDPEVYRLFAAGRTFGVFQFESSGMREYLRQLGPTCIEDLIAMNALYRPGPLDSGMTDVYIKCKNGKEKIKYEHPLLEPILKDTYGVIVFQEQVLKIAREMGGFSLGKADILRKAMGKKQADVMAAQKTEFIEGAAQRGIHKEIAEKVFDQMETFGRYGFVKAHSAGYAVIAYKTAFLKCHFPHEFLAASMTSEMSDASRIMLFRKECHEMGIELLPPDVNRSRAYFCVENDRIIFGLAAVKNVGVGAAESIVKERSERGPFTSIFDFCQRVDLRLVNKKALESLVACGAFDSLYPNRAELYENIELLIGFGAAERRQSDIGQSSLFGSAADESATPMAPRLKEIAPWNDSQKRDMEKKVLGFYLSSHPLEDNLIEYRAFADTSLDLLEGLPDGRRIIVGGVIQSVRHSISRNKKPFATMVIEDFNDSIEVLVFESLITKKKKLLSEGNAVLIQGILSTREGEKPKLKASDIVMLNEAFAVFRCSLHLYVNELEMNDEKLGFLKSQLAQHSGDGELVVHLRDDGAELVSRSRKFTVETSKKFVELLMNEFGETNVKLVPNNWQVTNGK